MSQDLTNEQKLEEIYKLTLENNHILHGLRNRFRVATVFRVIYWLAIIGALGGAYYYVRPAIDTMNVYQERFNTILHQYPEAKLLFPFAKSTTTEPTTETPVSE
ncbi:MAG: hypothetical protein KBC50_01380 [Candidatus Pacebacteria bacterium]|jgi:F0F1-type ATP synthase gamma subunit|nr:hypothetical protein [Candidatus Paceibacterota bacterium]